MRSCEEYWLPTSFGEIVQSASPFVGAFESLTLFRLGGHNVPPPYRFFPCCDKTVYGRLMKLSDF